MQRYRRWFFVTDWAWVRLFWCESHRFLVLINFCPKLRFFILLLSFIWDYVNWGRATPRMDKDLEFESSIAMLYLILGYKYLTLSTWVKPACEVYIVQYKRKQRFITQCLFCFFAHTFTLTMTIMCIMVKNMFLQWHIKILCIWLSLKIGI